MHDQKHTSASSDIFVFKGYIFLLQEHILSLYGIF